MPPFPSRLRKTPLVFILLMFFYLLHRYFFTSESSGGLQTEVAQLDTHPQVEVSLCRNIVDRRPFGEDSVFVTHQNRVYFYSRMEKPQPSRHVWFREGDTIQIVECPVENPVCISFVTPEKLSSGLWSVDFVSLNKLLELRQFRVVDSTGIRRSRKWPLP